MTRARPSALRRANLPLIVLLVLGLGLALPAAVRAAEPGGGAYDLTFLVLARGPQVPEVAVSYSHQIGHDALRAGLEELARRTGARLEGVSISDGPLGREPTPVGTGASFRAPGLLDRRSGALPVGPVARSLPEWRRMRMLFLLDEEFPFRGPGDVAADGFAVSLLSRVAPYEYDVERMTGPAARPAPDRPPAVPPDPGPSPLLAGLVGAPIGFVLGWVVPVTRRARSQTESP